MSQQKPIILFPGVQILSNCTIHHIREYLKRYCIIDTLGDTLYVKKPGNDSTTYAIEFDSGELYGVRKIKDANGSNLDEIIFKNNDLVSDGDNYGDGNNDGNNDNYDPVIIKIAFDEKDKPQSE